MGVFLFVVCFVGLSRFCGVGGGSARAGSQIREMLFDVVTRGSHTQSQHRTQMHGMINGASTEHNQRSSLCSRTAARECRERAAEAH